MQSLYRRLGSFALHQQELFEVRTKERVIADYIAAMTDRYAMKTYHEVYGLSL